MLTYVTTDAIISRYVTYVNMSLHLQILYIDDEIMMDIHADECNGFRSRITRQHQYWQLVKVSKTAVIA